MNRRERKRHERRLAAVQAVLWRRRFRRALRAGVERLVAEGFELPAAAPEHLRARWAEIVAQVRAEAAS